MRFLCLHGRGTNSKIFEMQTAAIRYELGDHHTYDFVEGTVAWEIDPQIKSLLPNEHNVFTYFDYTSTKSTLKALDDLDTFLETDGPYDGVIVFSQAASLVSTWMIRRINQGKPIESVFRCAIFLSAALLPYDYKALQDGKMNLLDTARLGEIIDIPTAHVWGKEDQYSDAAKELSKICKSEVKSVFIHNGGHEVPGSGSKEAVSKSVNVIRRAVQAADAAA